MGVDEFGGTGRGIDEEAEPGEGVLLEEVPALAHRHFLAADAAGAVSSHQVVTADFLQGAVGVGEQDAGTVRGDVDHGGVGDTEPDIATVPRPGICKVDEHVGLRVEPGGVPDQLLEVDAVALAGEAHVDPGVGVTVSEDSVGDVVFDQHADAVDLQDAGSHGGLDASPRAVVDVDRVDASTVQQVGQHQPGRAAPDDADGGVGDGAWGHESFPFGTFGAWAVSGVRGGQDARGDGKGVVGGGDPAVHRGLQDQFGDLVVGEAVAAGGQ